MTGLSRAFSTERRTKTTAAKHCQDNAERNTFFPLLQSGIKPRALLAQRASRAPLWAHSEKSI